MTDSLPLYDVNLQALTAEELLGPWKLACLRPAQGDTSGWSDATHIQLDDGLLRLYGPSDSLREGSWHLQRHNRLGQPYVVFTLPNAPAQALITRLRRSPGGEIRQMVVYFQSGLELQFTHP